MFIAGIDGGGTHTRIEVRDLENKFLRSGEFGPFNINAIGETAFAALLREVFSWPRGLRIKTLPSQSKCPSQFIF